MMVTSSPSTDPFRDPAASETSAHPVPDPANHPRPTSRQVEEQESDEDGSAVVGSEGSATLNLSPDTILTLGPDSLLVRDATLSQRRSARTCCGLFPGITSSSRSIPYTHVLWASVDAFTLTIRYAEATSKKACRAANLSYNLASYSLAKADHSQIAAWTEQLLRRAYPAGSQRAQRIYVLVNPFGGQGNADKLWTHVIAPIFAAANCHVEVQHTQYRGHAIELARTLDTSAWDVVACASGDGLPHEVFNGLAKQAHPRKALREIAVVQLPCGSGNAMSLNLNGTDSPSLAALAIVKGTRTALDLVAITQGQEKYFSFLSQAVGIIAETDLGTESLRWMGPLRFTWGILVRILFKTIYPADVAVVLESDDKLAIKDSFRAAASAAETSPPPPVPRDFDEAEVEENTTSLPPLQYGTITDPLPPTFTHESLSTLGNFYAGNMRWMSPDALFFATAQPNDGFQDIITISALISRRAALEMLGSVATGGIIDRPDVRYRKVRAYRVTPKPKPISTKFSARLGRWLGGGSGKQSDGSVADAQHPVNLIAIDGESVPCEPFQAEVVPRLGTTLSCRAANFGFGS